MQGSVEIFTIVIFLTAIIWKKTSFSLWEWESTPQLDVMDAGFSLIMEGVQHNLLCSRVLNHERMDTRVGDIAVEVIKPS